MAEKKWYEKELAGDIWNNRKREFDRDPSTAAKRAMQNSGIPVDNKKDKIHMFSTGEGLFPSDLEDRERRIGKGIPSSDIGRVLRNRNAALSLSNPDNNTDSDKNYDRVKKLDPQYAEYLRKGASASQYEIDVYEKGKQKTKRWYDKATEKK